MLDIWVLQVQFQCVQYSMHIYCDLLLLKSYYGVFFSVIEWSINFLSSPKSSAVFSFTVWFHCFSFFLTSQDAVRENHKKREMEEKIKRAKIAKEKAEREKIERQQKKKQLIDMNKGTALLSRRGLTEALIVISQSNKHCRGGGGTTGPHFFCEKSHFSPLDHSHRQMYRQIRCCWGCCIEKSGHTLF